MSKRSRRKHSEPAPRQSGGLSPAVLTVLIAFGTIGGLTGAADFISAVTSAIEAASRRCTNDGGGGR
jgi:hypothetical protein